MGTATRGATLKRVEAEAVATLGGQAARGVTRLVQGTSTALHDAVYGRLTTWFGPAVAPIRLLHGAQLRHTFFWVHTGLEVAARAAAAVSHARADDVGSICERPRGHGALAILNGISGDHLHRHGSALAVPMSLRLAGRDVPATAQGLRAAYREGGARLAVFVHGLVETEDAWRYRAHQRWGDPTTSYGSRLQADLGYVPLWVRYNTGLGVAANGAALADLLGAVVGAWPDPVEDVVLIGHSMGGLVALSALQAEQMSTVPVRAAVTLGSPREGAPLEGHAAAAEQFARALPPAVWLGGLLGIRSEGIRDLHSERVLTPSTPGSVAHYAVLATVTGHVGSTIGVRIGDGLVPVPRRHTVQTAVMGGLHHLDLLNHPRVYDQLTSWLAPSGGASTLEA